jgi:hypothetical protein
LDSLVLDTAVGLIFTFAVLSAIVTVLTETVTRFLGLRGEYLLRGLRSLLEKENNFGLLPWGRAQEEPHFSKITSDIVGSAFFQKSGSQGTVAADAGNARLTRKQRRQLPSYFSGRAFARALIGTLTDAGPDLRQQIEALPEPLRSPLRTLLDEADGNIAVFRKKIEEWYDDQMARVSGWYKVHVRWISFGLALILVVLFNINVFQVTRALYTDEAIRSAVVTQAGNAADCGDKTPAVCLDELSDQVQQAQASGVPLGWSRISAGCSTDDRATSATRECDFFERHGFADLSQGFGADLRLFLLAVLGWLLMAFTAVPGARFWYDALARLGSLRESGPRPSTSV